MGLTFISVAVGLNVGHTLQLTGHRLQVTSHKQENDSKFENILKCDIRSNVCGQAKSIERSLCLKNNV